MLLAWRLTPPAFAEVLDGEGNRATGARWNSPGRGVVYCSANLSLCVLETYVHIPAALRSELPDFEAVRVSIPEDAGTTRISIAEFEQLMLARERRSAFRAVGDRWLAAAADLVLAAPSVLVPEELNIMLNPAHARMRDVSIVYRRPFRFDVRLATA